MTPATLGASAITVSLELAKKLKEAGFPQDTTIFMWQADGNNAALILSSGGASRATSPFSYYAAPTAEEVLRRLPKKIENQYDRSALLTADHHPDMELWEVNYLDNEGKAWWIDGGVRHVCGRGDTLANAAAMMWIFLKEHKLTCNACLNGACNTCSSSSPAA